MGFKTLKNFLFVVASGLTVYYLTHGLNNSSNVLDTYQKLNESLTQSFANTTTVVETNVVKEDDNAKLQFQTKQISLDYNDVLNLTQERNINIDLLNETKDRQCEYFDLKDRVIAFCKVNNNYVFYDFKNNLKLNMLKKDNYFYAEKVNYYCSTYSGWTCERYAYDSNYKVYYNDRLKYFIYIIAYFYNGKADVYTNKYHIQLDDVHAACNFNSCNIYDFSVSFENNMFNIVFEDILKDVIYANVRFDKHLILKDLKEFDIENINANDVNVKNVNKNIFIVATEMKDDLDNTFHNVLLECDNVNVKDLFDKLKLLNVNLTMKATEDDTQMFVSFEAKNLTLNYNCKILNYNNVDKSLFQTIHDLPIYIKSLFLPLQLIDTFTTLQQLIFNNVVTELNETKLEKFDNAKIVLRFDKDALDYVNTTTLDNAYVKAKIYHSDYKTTMYDAFSKIRFHKIQIDADKQIVIANKIYTIN